MLGIVCSVAANSATGFDGPISKRRTGAPITIAGAFFVPAHSVYGGCAWETFGSAGFLLPRSVNLRTAATLIRLTANRGSSSAKGVPLMPNIVLPNSRASHSGNILYEFLRSLADQRTAASNGGTQ